VIVFSLGPFSSKKKKVGELFTPLMVKRDVGLLWNCFFSSPAVFPYRAASGCVERVSGQSRYLQATDRETALKKTTSFPPFYPLRGGQRGVALFHPPSDARLSALLFPLSEEKMKVHRFFLYAGKWTTDPPSNLFSPLPFFGAKEISRCASSPLPEPSSEDKRLCNEIRIPLPFPLP